MSKAIVCDMCGKVIKCEKDSSCTSIFIANRSYFDDIGYLSDTRVRDNNARSADLCESCSTKVYDFIFNYGPNKVKTSFDINFN